MMEESQHKFQGRGESITCANCGKRFQVVGKVPRDVVQPACPHCGHSEVEDDE